MATGDKPEEQDLTSPVIVVIPDPSPVSETTAHYHQEDGSFH